ncbi:MAG: signal peptidase I [Planctomycetota bacterium]|nr:MAG: signal peptidase I [Planctomycetota bacterium]
MRPKWKTLILKLWREWVRPLLMVVIVLSAFRSTVADWNDVPTGSMKPTILEGDRILVNKLAYDLKVPFTGWQLLEWGGPQRGDVVICYSPESGIRLVKRVIGLPADRVEMRNDQLIINGRLVGYEKLDPEIINQIPADQQKRHIFAAEKISRKTHPVMITPDQPAPRFFGPVTVPDGQYLVLGDNRDNSRDSRSFGCVPHDMIVGRAVAVVLSVDRDNWYAPRWNRFFRSLP